MRLSIRHTTSYDYGAPVPYGLMQVRLTPKSTAQQKVIDWRLEIEGGRQELAFTDQNNNRVTLLGFDPGVTRLVLTAVGEMETTDTAGVVGPHGGYMPLWLFERQTALTTPGRGCRGLMAEVSADADLTTRLHGLSAAIREAVAWTPGRSEVDWTAEEALKAGHGVCQDHAHVFVACARAMGVPARYVSGYLMMTDRIEQEASHAWAEAHVEGLGWVGFDISNGISPDERYVRVATGLDYAEAAPIHGIRQGGAGESLTVSLAVEQMQQQ